MASHYTLPSVPHLTIPPPQPLPDPSAPVMENLVQSLSSDEKRGKNPPPKPKNTAKKFASQKRQPRATEAAKTTTEK